ncbi:hypothetical protein SUGI_0873720 [Cryptomeria japonica]|nr:hypothetical protein SUGI_0873720 [Cryptomeria japonica]
MILMLGMKGFAKVWVFTPALDPFQRMLGGFGDAIGVLWFEGTTVYRREVCLMTRAGCVSDKKIEGGSMFEQKMEGGFGSQGGCAVGLRDGHQAVQELDNVGVQNLKLLENAQVDGWIEVKRKKGKKVLVGSVCIAPPLEGWRCPWGGGSLIVATIAIETTVSENETSSSGKILARS